MLDPAFGASLVAKITLLTCFWAQMVAMAVLAYEATGSAVWVGITTAVQIAPQLLLALPSGSMADKRGPMAPIVAGGIAMAVGCLSLGLWFAVPGLHDRLPAIVPILLATVICGVGVALASAPMQAVAPRLSRPNEYVAAMSLNFLPAALGRTTGPVLAAVLIVIAGSTATLIVVGAAALCAASVFACIRKLRNGSAARERVRLGKVLTYVSHDRHLLAAIGAVAAIGAASEAAITLGPAYAITLELSGADGGWVTGAFGLGGLLGVVVFNLTNRVFRPATNGCLGMAFLGLSLVLAGVIPVFAFATAMLILGGASMVVGITAFGIIVQQRSPGEYLGRVMGLWVIAFTGVRPLAGVALGAVSDHISTALAFACAGAFIMLVAIIGTVARGRVRSGVPQASLGARGA